MQRDLFKHVYTRMPKQHNFKLHCKSNCLFFFFACFSCIYVYIYFMCNNYWCRSVPFARVKAGLFQVTVVDNIYDIIRRTKTRRIQTKVVEIIYSHSHYVLSLCGVFVCDCVVLSMCYCTKLR